MEKPTIKDVLVLGPEDDPVVDQTRCAACGEIFEEGQRSIWVPAPHYTSSAIELEHLWCAVRNDEVDLTGPLSFEEFHRTNVDRKDAWHAGVPWDLADWFVALVGELGEAANVAKKLKRASDGLKNVNDPDTEALQRQLAEELADVYCYFDLVCDAAGVDLAAEIVTKFNAVSEREGLPHRIRESLS